MPVVGIPTGHLKRLIGESYENEELVKMCQELGCDVEDLALINRVKCAKCGQVAEYGNEESFPNECEYCQNSFEKDTAYQAMDPVEMIRLDLLADRPDNFDAGGLARTIRGYLELETGLKEYPLSPSGYEVLVDPSTQYEVSYRPYIACAVVKDFHFDEDSLKNIMKLQENLHWALGRDRKFASIGVYDLKNISRTIKYTTVDPKQGKFIPLGADGLGDEYLQTPEEILQNHPKGKAYARLLTHLKKYPMLVDSRGLVLSMPPIINSEQTKVQVGTDSVFIDVTGLNENLVHKALNIMVTNLKEWNPQCRIESVNIKGPGKHEETTPHLSGERFTLNPQECVDRLGVEMDNAQIIKCLEKTRFNGIEKDGTIEVTVPCYRNDIIHEYDLIEDVAIGYGYKNIKARPLESYTVGNILPEEKRKNEFRTIMTGLGFLEVINIMLTSEKRAYERLNLPDNPERALIDNPISSEQTMVRTDLLSGLIETIANNTHHELPQKIFEVGEVIFHDEKNEHGSREETRVAAAIVSGKTGFAEIKSVLRSLERESSLTFQLQEKDYPYYLQGRSAAILKDGEEIGHIGEIHPEILERFHVFNPIVLFEINPGN